MVDSFKCKWYDDVGHVKRTTGEEFNFFFSLTGKCFVQASVSLYCSHERCNWMSAPKRRTTRRRTDQVTTKTTWRFPEFKGPKAKKTRLTTTTTTCPAAAACASGETRRARWRCSWWRPCGPPSSERLSRWPWTRKGRRITIKTI